jgi:hypothetical protein
MVPERRYMNKGEEQLKGSKHKEIWKVLEGL